MDEKRDQKLSGQSLGATSPQPATADEVEVHFIEDDAILPLPLFVTRATLSDLFDMRPGDTLAQTLSRPKKNTDS